jgi:hypothetical protein
VVIEREKRFMIYVQKNLWSCKGGVFGGSLFLKIVPNEVTCGYHSCPCEKQLYRRCHWFYVISDKRSERIRGHYNENCWDKDRNFSRPLHARLTPGKRLKWEKPEKISNGE